MKKGTIFFYLGLSLILFLISGKVNAQTDKKAAEKEVEEYCKKLLANPIMEDFEFSLDKV